jgi:TonB family protein
MNRRFIIIFAMSVVIHLALLAIQFQQRESIVAGERNLVGLVAGNQEDFTPAESKISKVLSPKKGSTLQRPQNSKQAQNNKLRIKPSPRNLSVPMLKKVAEAAKLEKEVAEAVPPKSFERAVSVDVAVSSGFTSETADAGTAENSEQGQVKSELQSQGSSRQDVSLVSAIPRYADNPRPHYPEVARRKGWSGEVKLLVRVDETGSVDEISIHRSSGYSVLDRAARRSVRLWRFMPATEAGRGVVSEVVVPVNFHLPESAETQVPAQK